MKPRSNIKITDAAAYLRSKVTAGVDLARFKRIPSPVGDDSAPVRYRGSNGIRVDIYCNGATVRTKSGSKITRIGEGALKLALEAAATAAGDGHGEEIQP